MDFTEKQKEQMREYVERTDGVGLEEALRAQIEIVIREHAKLSAYLEGGPEVSEEEMKEVQRLKALSSDFMNEAVKIARKLNIQLQ